jgi:adenylate cyclase
MKRCLPKVLKVKPPNESFHAHALLCYLYTLTRQHEKALEEGEKSIALAPNSADAHAWYSYAQTFAGEPAKAIPLAEKALRLNPFPPSWYFLPLGTAYRFLGRYDDAISAFKKTLSMEPSNLFGAIGLTVAYALSGRKEEAEAQAEEVLSMDPSFSFESFLERVPFRNQAEKDRTIEALRKAGLK